MTRERIPLAAELDEGAELDDNDQWEIVIQKYNNLTSTFFEKAVVYTNLILLAGYAGFFGLWQLTKD